jgi:hypothetical protein
MTDLCDVLEFKGFEGWATSGDTITHWVDEEAGRKQPTAQEIAAWTAEYEAQGGDAILLDKKKTRQATAIPPLLKALVLALNDGSFVPGSGYNAAQIRSILKAKL